MTKKTLVLSLCLAFYALVANATDLTTGGGAYSVDELDAQKIYVTQIKWDNSNKFVIESTYTISSETYTVKGIGYDETCGSETVRGLAVKATSGVKTTLATELTLPASLEMIASNALAGWTGLTTLNMLATDVPSLGENALPENLNKIVVPKGLAKTYADAEGWKEFAKIIEDVDGEKAVEEPAPTSLSNAKSAKMRIDGRTLNFDQEVEVEVYSITGALEFAGKTAQVVLKHKGIYIVKYDNNTSKITVK